MDKVIVIGIGIVSAVVIYLVVTGQLLHVV